MAMEQLGLALKKKTWGGAREGAGRPRLAPGRRSPAHIARPGLKRRFPLHVTVRMAPWVQTLRRKKALRVIERAFWKAQGRFAMRLVHFAVEENHLHLIVETTDKNALRRAITGLNVRIAKGLNKV